ncbi:DoxX family protein [Pedobacter sp. N36a]|uniref:DoxX family protein n=1 Tax=Pedobacter sp. N36a TaxID=2767996 RepID=UPI0016570965|nr:DoxX family protein [Pedobacter sp. N36a]MBC8984914.1 DoxX family protein [Pedobacter sp. N36a]
MLLNILILASAVSFLFYGISCLLNSGMKEEFYRYGLDKFRKLIGFLQLLGGAGLLVGFAWQPALIIASGGLSLLMLIGFCIRLKMKDGFWESIPSFIFLLLNLYICIQTIGLR